MPFDGIVESSTPILVPSTVTACQGADITTWPWPRMLFARYHTFGFFKQQNGNLYLFEMTLTNYGRWEMYVVGDLGVASQVSQIDVADFGPFYIVTTLGQDNSLGRVVQTFIRDTVLTNETADRDLTGINFITSFTLPGFGTVCNFNGQIVGGNIYSPSVESTNYWADLGTDSIVWAGIGNLISDPSTDPTAGFLMTLRSPLAGRKATIFKLLPMISVSLSGTTHDSIIVYADSGKTILRPDVIGGTFTFGENQLSGLGVRSGNHVCGDALMHGFVDLNNEFWQLEPGPKLTKRGYKEHIATLNTSTAILSYDRRNAQFYFSDGTKCLVINEFGAYMCHQRVNSIGRGHDGRLYGTFSDNGDKEVRITTDSLNFGSIGLKSIEALLAKMSYPSGVSTWLSVDWKATNSTSFTSRPWVPAGPIGRAVMHTTGLDLRLRVRFSDYTNVELFSLLANVKYSDQRFKRGTVPSQYEVGVA